MKMIPSLSLALVLAAALRLLPGAAAAAPPLFSPEPPEPAAAALVETYLTLLTAGEFDQALALNDHRGMRQYLLDRRLAELKLKNPELTRQDLEAMSAKIQLNELNPARLQAILKDVMNESNYAGMTWRLRGYAPGPAAVGGFLAGVDARTAAGQEKPILLGIRKLGEQWLVAPEIVEELASLQPAIHLVPPVPTPPEVAALVDAFWQLWQKDELSDAHGLFGVDYRTRVPLDRFRQEARELLAVAGPPVSWKIIQTRQIEPGSLWIGVTVQGAADSLQSILRFTQMGETWVLVDAQFRLTSPVPPAPESPPAAAPEPPEPAPAEESAAPAEAPAAP